MNITEQTTYSHHNIHQHYLQVFRPRQSFPDTIHRPLDWAVDSNLSARNIDLHYLVEGYTSQEGYKKLVGLFLPDREAFVHKGLQGVLGLAGGVVGKAVHMKLVRKIENMDIVVVVQVWWLGEIVAEKNMDEPVVRLSAL
jgi:hypothetical protein